MLTYDFEDIGKDTLYEYLYRKIRADILSGRLRIGEKIPSKREFARNNGVSTITVENTYAQLTAEGYLSSVPRKGYYVADIGTSLLLPGMGREAEMEAGQNIVQNREQSTVRNIVHKAAEKGEQGTLESSDPGHAQDVAAGSTKLRMIDLSGSGSAPETFPFSRWAKLSRAVLEGKREELLTRAPGAGVMELRNSIAQYLLQYQNLKISPEQIVLGAGTEYLYSLLIRLLGMEKIYAVEDPGYPKTGWIYESNGVEVRYIPMDQEGIALQPLRESEADVVHISPSHQFPTGITMPVGRRAALLSWCREGEERYIIEDDYDSEFRLSGRPIPCLASIDRTESVIYLNTFTKSLASTIRISYMVLPGRLLTRYREKLGFYSCTVSNFEQYTLAEMIGGGFYEKHINRMRNYYRGKQKKLLGALKVGFPGEKIRFRGAGSGLHFLMELDTDLTEQELTDLALTAGVKIFGLESFRSGKERAETTGGSGPDGEKEMREDKGWGKMERDERKEKTEKTEKKETIETIETIETKETDKNEKSEKNEKNKKKGKTGRKNAKKSPSMVVSYAGLSDEDIEALPGRLWEAWGELL